MALRRLLAAAALLTFAVPCRASTLDDMRTVAVLEEAGKPDALILVATRALNTDVLRPVDRAGFLAMRGAAYVVTGRTGPGDRDFAAAFRADADGAAQRLVRSTAVHAYMNRAMHLEGKQLWEQSLVSYAAALNYDPDNAEILAARANAHFRLTEFDEAVADYRRAVALDGGNVEYHIGLGSCLESALDFDGAIAEYTRAIALAPENNVPLIFRGRALAILGEDAKAERDLRSGQALEADPSGLVWLHILHLRHGVDDRLWLRKQVAGRELRHWPAPALSYFLGAISAEDLVGLALKSPETAMRHQRCDAWFYIGEDALARGRTDEARDLFNRTVAGCNGVDYEWNAAKMALRGLK